MESGSELFKLVEIIFIKSNQHRSLVLMRFVKHSLFDFIRMEVDASHFTQQTQILWRLGHILWLFMIAQAFIPVFGGFVITLNMKKCRIRETQVCGVQGLAFKLFAIGQLNR